MSLSHLPVPLSATFFAMAAWLHKKSAGRLPILLLGILFASGHRTATSWFRACDLWEDWRQGYVTIYATGRKTTHIAVTVVHAVRPVLCRQRLMLGIDDSPTPRYGPFVEGAGIHHNPTPGPAGEKHVYGHNWVILSALGHHPDWGTIALPLQAQLYVRSCDIDKLPPEREYPFRTKLQLASEQLRWLLPWVKGDFEQRWAVADGAYAKRAFLLPARADGWVVVSRLRKDAALWDLPPTERRDGQRGPMPTYGKNRISLAKRAGQMRGWEQVECVQYGLTVTKTFKTFLATYRPAGGLIRVVLVKEDNGWIPFFCTDQNATVVEILEAAADRSSVEQMHRDVKGVWGAGQQQVRNIYSSEACFNLNLWMHTLVEVWAWDKAEEDLIDRSKSPWDRQPRRPSHADKRKALQRQILRAEIDEALKGRPSKEKIRELTERLLNLAG